MANFPRVKLYAFACFKECKIFKKVLAFFTTLIPFSELDWLCTNRWPKNSMLKNKFNGTRNKRNRALDYTVSFVLCYATIQTYFATLHCTSFWSIKKLQFSQLQCSLDIATGLRQGGWGRYKQRGPYWCNARAPSSIGVDVAIASTATTSKVALSNGHRNSMKNVSTPHPYLNSLISYFFNYPHFNVC